MKKKGKQMLVIAGGLCFVLALFQAIIGFSPSLSLYFGAPEALVESTYALLVVSILIAGLLVVFGLYAISGAGHIRPLPWLKQILVAISGIFILRGLLLVPELLAISKMLSTPIHVAPRFIVFSLGSLLIGLIFIAGTIDRWNSFCPPDKRIAQ